MCLAFLKRFLLGELIINALFVTTADGVVYYVTPMESLSSECPEQPCQTMEYYFNHGNIYFGRKAVNITMKFL